MTRRAKIIGNNGINRHFLKIGSICEITDMTDEGYVMVIGEDVLTGEPIIQQVSLCDIEEIKEND